MLSPEVAPKRSLKLNDSLGDMGKLKSVEWFSTGSLAACCILDLPACFPNGSTCGMD